MNDLNKYLGSSGLRTKIISNWYLHELTFNDEKKSNISFGVRPWPLHGYAQLGFDTKEGKSVLLTFEGGTGQEISMYSYGLVTVGFRWDIFKNKK